MNSINYPKLPVLQAMIDRLSKGNDLNLENITFVCVQHLLFTTVNLIEALITLGAKPNNIHILGKIYSNSPEVIEKMLQIGVIYHPNTLPQKLGYFHEYFVQDVIKMWEEVSNRLTQQNSRIIVLDDGGQCVSNIPNFIKDNHHIFAVEQTSSGVTRIKNDNIAINVVNVAFSAAKQKLESPMIAKAVVKKLDQFLSLHNQPLKCGVAGLGVIGQAVVTKLMSFGHEVVVYDKLLEKSQQMEFARIVNNIQFLFNQADYIFGCAGEDITISLDINQIKGIKHLISCSSQDIEFRSLLRIIDSNITMPINPLDNIDFALPNGMIKLLRGGYPMNLDNSGESVPAKDIQLTRSLLLGGIIQAVCYFQSQAKQGYKQYMLHPKIQKLVVQEFLKHQRLDLSSNNLLVPVFVNNEEWIQSNSHGEYVDNDLIAYYFY